MYGLGGLEQVEVWKRRRRAKWLEEKEKEKKEKEEEKTKDRSVPDGSDNKNLVLKLTIHKNPTPRNWKSESMAGKVRWVTIKWEMDSVAKDSEEDGASYQI